MRLSQKAILLLIFIVAGGLFLIGIDWGLPSRDADAFLFAGRVPWTGPQIMQLAGAWETESDRGADVAMHPLAGGDQPVVVNDTDAKRAQIVRRYRLYSNQPDEMITFRSLSRMKPGKLDFDPALYQYGGLWIYPVGGLLKIASLLHWIHLRGDLAFYLDHPEEFGRFYVVARCYSAAWGLAGVLVVFALGHELFGSFLAGATAAGVYAAMPVVIDLAHEAKPHLAGTVLTLLTVLAGVRYVRTGCRKTWIAAGVLAGTSVGMVLSGYVAFAVLPMMAILRPISWKKKIQVTAAATLVALTVFVITNPYLPINLLFHRQVLHSNVGNSVDFYKPSISVAGLSTAWRSLTDGMSIVPLLVGLLGALIAVAKKKSTAAIPAAVGGVVLVQLILLGRGKPAEYGRFALTLDVILGLSAAGLIAGWSAMPREKSLAALLLVAATLFFGLRYDINFIADRSETSTRHQAAETIAADSRGASVLMVWAEPAPYCLPPVDLFHWQIVLEPRGAKVSGLEDPAIAVRAVDEARGIDPLAPPRVASPISWANKPIEIFNLPVPRQSR